MQLKEILNLVVWGFDALTGLIVLISTIGFCNYHHWQWPTLCVFAGLNISLRAAVRILSMFLCKPPKAA